jgi:hypothetical protein
MSQMRLEREPAFTVEDLVPDIVERGWHRPPPRYVGSSAAAERRWRSWLPMPVVEPEFDPGLVRYLRYAKSEWDAGGEE